MRIISLFLCVSLFSNFFLFSCDSPASREKSKAQYAIAGQQFENGDFDLCIRTIDQADIHTDQAMTLKGKALYFSDNPEHARSVFNAVFGRSRSIESGIWLCRSMTDSGDIKKTKEIVDLLLATSPFDFRVLELAYRLASEKKEDANALLYLDRGIDSLAQGASLYVERARILNAMGEKDKAITDLKRAASLLDERSMTKQSVLDTIDRLSGEGKR